MSAYFLKHHPILDEAWGEIDHSLRYPDRQDDPDLSRKMILLNQSINTCEESANTYFKEFQSRTIDSIDQVVNEAKYIINNDENHIDVGSSVDDLTSSEHISNNILKQIAFNSDAIRYFETIKQSMPSEAIAKQLEAYKAVSMPAVEAIAKQLEIYRAASMPSEAIAKQLEIYRAASMPAVEAIAKQLEIYRAASMPSEAIAKQLEIYRAASMPSEAIAKQLEIYRAASMPSEAIAKQLEAYKAVSMPSEAIAKQLERYRAISKPIEKISKQFNISTHPNNKKKKDSDDPE